MENDNSKQIFFDAIYDNTIYSLANEYAKEKTTMDTKTFFEFLTNKIMDIMKLTKQNALREAKAIIEEKREVIDGDYCLLVDKDTNKNYIYIRKDSNWILDDKFKNDFYIDSNKILCDVNKDCISINDKCVNSSNLEKTNLKEDVNKILDSFQAKYNLSIEQIKGKINDNYENAKKYLKNIILIKNEKDEYVNKIILDNFIEISDDIQSSPYENIRDKILSISDFVKRQEYIKIFCLKFARDAISDEEPNWLYCVKTGIKLIPKFLLKLANVFSNKQDYIRELDTICSEQGTISDDNNYWVDKYSGYIIKNIDFSSDEGYDEQGFKLNTREILENEYSINLSKLNSSTNPDIKIITNIIKSMSQMIGINIESHTQFIIKNVVTTQSANIPSKEQYEKLLEKTAKKQGKTKDMPSYEDTYNQLLLLLTLSYLIIAIQINIPSFKTKKTFPGCIKSFSGYPLEGDQDKTSIIYISCIASKIKSSIKPWNTLLKISEANIAKKIEALIEKYIINDKIIIELFQKKKEYLILNKEESIPEQLSISNWHNFMPPLYNLKISKENSLPLSDTLKDELVEIYRRGKKNEILEILLSKNIYLSNTIIQSIQKIVEINTSLLETSSGDPFLENACCNSTINTINYFITNDKTILENNKLIEYYNKLINYIHSLNKCSILYNAENTKSIIPNIIHDFNEETIYKSFIYYCNFTNNLPIDDEIRSICMDKPSEFDETKNIIENIESLKAQGKIYLNKETALKKIPSHWQLSEIHNKDLLNILDKYYKHLNNFTVIPGLNIVFKSIQNKCKIFLKLIKFCNYIPPIRISNLKEEKYIFSIFDKEFITYFYKYIFYSIFNEFIKITQNEEFILESAQEDEYNESDMNIAIINYIHEFLNIMNTHSNLINNTYKKVKEKISYAKEKEKDLITEYLKNLTDEEREVENIFKNNKLESWSAGLQKGLTQYVASNYDEERSKIEKQALKEYKLRQNNNVTEMNKEIYKLDIEETERIEKEIEDEEYDITNIPDDDDALSDIDYD